MKNNKNRKLTNIRINEYLHTFPKFISTNFQKKTRVADNKSYIHSKKIAKTFPFIIEGASPTKQINNCQLDKHNKRISIFVINYAKKI